MKKNLQIVFSICAVVFMFSALAIAQESRSTISAANKYVISAEAGGVNYVEGKVLVKRNSSTSGYLLKGDSVIVGDKISTGADGKAEILLNPGSFARVGGNSDFEFVETSLDNLEVKLDRGSVIFEVVTSDDFGFLVKTPKAFFSVIRSGVYRVDVLEDGTGKLEVWKGRALIGEDEDAKVKKGRTATVDGSDVAIAKFDRDDRDELEQWSKDRSKELAKINSRFEQDNLRNTLINSFGNNGWNLYDTFGVWVYDPFFGAYSFLPFGSSWYSPYGYGYRRDIWSCRLPRYIYYAPPYNTNGSNQNNTGSNNVPRRNTITGNQRTKSADPPTRRVDPPQSVTFPGSRKQAPSNFPSIIPRRTSPSMIPSSPAPSKKGDN